MSKVFIMKTKANKQLWNFSLFACLLVCSSVRPFFCSHICLLYLHWKSSVRVKNQYRTRMVGRKVSWEKSKMSWPSLLEENILLGTGPEVKSKTRKLSFKCCLLPTSPFPKVRHLDKQGLPSFPSEELQATTLTFDWGLFARSMLATLLLLQGPEATPQFTAAGSHWNSFSDPAASSGHRPFLLEIPFPPPTYVR